MHGYHLAHFHCPISYHSPSYTHSTPSCITTSLALLFSHSPSHIYSILPPTLLITHAFTHMCIPPPQTHAFPRPSSSLCSSTTYTVLSPYCGPIPRKSSFPHYFFPRTHDRTNTHSHTYTHMHTMLFPPSPALPVLDLFVWSRGRKRG